MSRINLSTIDYGDAITVTKPNADCAEWRTRTGDIDDANVRPGGIDGRNITDTEITARPSGGLVFNDSTNTASIASSSVPTVPIVLGGADVEIGAYTFDSATGEDLIVRCSFEYVGDLGTNTPHLGGPVYTFQMGYSTDGGGSGGTWTLIAETKREAGIGWGSATSSNPKVTSSCTIAFRFGVAVGSVSDLYFGLFVWEPNVADNVDIQKVFMHAVHYKR